VKNRFTYTAGGSYNTATGAVQVTGGVGVAVELPKLERCGLEIFAAEISTTNELAISAQGLQFSPGKLEVGATVLGGVMEFKYQILPPE
jgi:hypothetical protein